jgi:hypothetical protein
LGPFEYVGVVLSLILGLIITQIIAGIVDYIHHAAHVRFYWLWAVWVLFVFTLAIQEWFIEFRLQSIQVWTPRTLLFILAYPISLFLTTRFLFPSIGQGVLDLRLYYFDHYPRFFGAALFMAGVAVVSNILIEGYSLKEQYVQGAICLLLAGVLIFRPSRPWIHQTIGLAMLASTLGYLIFSPEMLE